METRLIKETKIFHLSTQSNCGIILNQDVNFKSDMLYSIPHINFKDEETVFVSFSVPYAIIPCSMFNINYSNNRLDVLIGSINYTYSFPYGNYNANSFMSALTTLLGTNWSISFNGITNCFTINNSVSAFSLLSSSTIDAVMGFSTTLSSSTTALGNSVVMTRTCNFLQIPRINMKCRDLANSQGVGLEGSFSYSDIIISIPNDAPLSGKINYSNTTQIMNQLEIRDLKRFRVCFCDDDNNLINFNGLSCYFAFQFDIYRQPKLIKDPTFRQLFNQ